MNKLLRFFVFLIALSFVFFNSVAQTIRYVTQGGAGAKDGTDWANAVDDLQGAIQASSANDIVVVANGTYLPTRKANALNTITLGNRENAFVLKANVKIYGSFQGNETITIANLQTMLAQRNLSLLGGLSPGSSGGGGGSVLSGDFNGNDVITNTGKANLAFLGNTENAYHVVISANSVGTAELNGFTISGGYANSNTSMTVNEQAILHYRGGGVYLTISTPILANVVVENNFLTLTTNSYLTCYGAGIFITSSGLNLSNFIIRNNLIRDPNNRSYGGGLATFTYNSLGFTLSNGLFENNIVSSGYDDSFGGAIFNTQNLTINNVVFYNNRAVSSVSYYNGFGGAIYSGNANLTLNNITAYGNTANNGSFLYDAQSTSSTNKATINNSIIWGNNIAHNNTVPTVNNSIVQGGYAGTGNLNLDPQFTDAANGNFTLKRNSPAIEGGNNIYLPSGGGGLDLAGNPRKQGKNIDLGAYEYPFNTNALHFDGSNDVVTIPASTWLDVPELTLEAWFKPERQIGGNQTIFASRSSGATRFSILHSTNGIVLWNGSNSASVNLPQPFALNRWYHLAVVLTSGAANIYINGQLLGSMAIGTGAATNLPFQLGAAVPDGSYETFKGSINEVRIWNTARTATQIADNFNTPLSLYNQSNLLAYFDFSEGMAGADNTGLTNNIANLANESLSGTMVNFAKNGTASNWVEGYAMVMPIALGANNITWNKFKLNWQAGYMPTAENYKIEVATDDTFTQPVAGSPFTVAGSQTSLQLSTLSPTTTYYYRAYAEKASVTGQGMLLAVQNITTLPLPPSPPGTALKFDGIDDYVSLGNSALLKPTSGLTVGVWVNRNDWNLAALKAIISNTEAGGYSINIGDATLGGAGKNITALIRRGSSYVTLTTDASALTPGWHHIALTYNGFAGILYVDGVIKSGLTESSNVPISYHASNSTIVGAEANNADGASGRWFTGGLIDELRIYDAALDNALIRDDMYSPTSVNPTNLVAHYKFDQATPTTRTVLDDAGTNALDGELRNFNFTAASNWVESYAMVVPTSITVTDKHTNGFTLNWEAPTVGTADGYILDVSPNANFSSPIAGSPFTLSTFSKEITGLTAFTNYYYRLRADKTSLTGTGAPVTGLVATNAKLNQTITFAVLEAKTTTDADFVLTASSNQGLPVTFTSSNTAVAEVYEDAGVWKVKLKSEGNTNITASQSGNQTYNPAANVVRNLVVVDGTLPVTFISFTAKVEGNHAKLQWQTANEVNNRGFEIYRSGDDKAFVKIGEVQATHNLQLATYNHLDKQPLNGINYYKLIQLDNNGKETELVVKLLAFNFKPSTLSLYPNPTTDKVTLQFEAGKYSAITIINAQGKLLRSNKLKQYENEIVLDLSVFPTGAYIIKLLGDNDSATKKIVKQ